MKAAAVLKWLMPREERFHELLDRDTANLVRGAGLFAEIAAGRNLGDRRVQWVELKRIEHEGDGITRQIFDALNSTFITPLDPEDIRSIATDLDDILDYLEAVAHDLVLFELEDSPEALRQFAEILVLMAAEIATITSLLWDLGNEARIREGMVRISDLENQADQLYSAVIADLFRGDGRNPLEILKGKEVYEGLEDACDQCKDYTHVVGNVVVKNS
jgi:predicted phosphate transport protein (TIGR00153 family)